MNGRLWSTVAFINLAIQLYLCPTPSPLLMGKFMEEIDQKVQTSYKKKSNAFK